MSYSSEDTKQVNGYWVKTQFNHQPDDGLSYFAICAYSPNWAHIGTLCVERDLQTKELVIDRFFIDPDIREFGIKEILFDVAKAASFDVSSYSGVI